MHIPSGKGLVLSSTHSEDGGVTHQREAFRKDCRVGQQRGKSITLVCFFAGGSLLRNEGSHILIRVLFPRPRGRPGDVHECLWWLWNDWLSSYSHTVPCWGRGGCVQGGGCGLILLRKVILWVGVVLAWRCACHGPSVRNRQSPRFEVQTLSAIFSFYVAILILEADVLSKLYRVFCYSLRAWSTCAYLANVVSTLQITVFWLV